MRRGFRGWGRVVGIGVVASLALAGLSAGAATADESARRAEIASAATDFGTPTLTGGRHRPPPAPTPVLQWTDCADGLQCATARVPLDYDRPTGSMISLALVRLPSTDPAQRRGSLFLNPGGPGGSGVDAVIGQAPFFPAELRSAYDIIGFDPRGISRSTPVRCFNTVEEAVSGLPPFAFPVTAAEEQVQQASDWVLSDACAGRSGAILDHMSTANVARDLDLLRKSVGDQRLNFLGLSYGSYIGLTYANLFPRTVGALVIDGVLDPIAWSTGRGDQALTQPFSTRLRSDQGAIATLGEFFRLCDEAAADCAFSGGARTRFDALAQRLLAEPVEVEDELGVFVFGYADLVANTLGVLYAAEAWPSFAAFLRQLEAAASAGALRESAAAFRAALGTIADPPEYDNFVEGFPAVGCSDTDNPLEYSAWPAAAAAADARYQYFGSPWTWASSVCQPWPGQDSDRYTGPWNARTATSVLVVGNYYDPATRYQGAVTAARLLPNSRLLSYAGWGHTASFSGNACVNDAIVGYLVTTVPPPRGTVCQPTGSPFQPADADARVAAVQPLLVPTLPESLRQAIPG